VEFFYGDPTLEPEESFLSPYLRASQDTSWVGVEDLVEVRLSYESGLKTGRRVPVLGGVLGIPHPYILSEEGETMEINL